MQRHLKILGVVYVVESILSMIVFIPIVSLLCGSSEDMLIFDSIPVSSSNFVVLFFIINLIVCILLFYYGISAMSFKKWTTGIGGYIFAIFQLVSFPIGTAIALYSFWILTKYEIEWE